jgi:hypothetical protein
MNGKAGIWIDHEKAVIASVSTEGVATEIVESHVEGHSRYDGRQDNGGEKKYEERHRQRLDGYYVIGRLGEPERILIFGPGEAKLQLQQRLLRSATPAQRSIEIDTTDKLTEPQIVAKVKTHFGL